jgi:hypothetical protein
VYREYPGTQATQLLMGITVCGCVLTRFCSLGGRRSSGRAKCWCSALTKRVSKNSSKRWSHR